MEIVKNAVVSETEPTTEPEPIAAAALEPELEAGIEPGPEQLPVSVDELPPEPGPGPGEPGPGPGPEPGPEPIPPPPGGQGPIYVPVPVPDEDDYLSDQAVVTSSIEEEVETISLLLDQAVARLADLQEQLPVDAQPVVTYMSDIIEGVGDTIEFLFDSLIDEVGGDTDAEMQEAVEVIGDEAAARPEDLRDLALTLQHVPGVEDHHLVRMARLADVLGEALSRTRGVRDTVNANPAAYADAFGQASEEV